VGGNQSPLGTYVSAGGKARGPVRSVRVVYNRHRVCYLILTTKSNIRSGSHPNCRINQSLGAGWRRYLFLGSGKVLTPRVQR